MVSIYEVYYFTLLRGRLKGLLGGASSGLRIGTIRWSSGGADIFFF